MYLDIPKLSKTSYRYFGINMKSITWTPCTMLVVDIVAAIFLFYMHTKCIRWQGKNISKYRKMHILVTITCLIVPNIILFGKWLCKIQNGNLRNAFAMFAEFINKFLCKESQKVYLADNKLDI